jgi:hypothetical protein
MMFCVSYAFLVFCRLLKENCGLKVKNAKFKGKATKRQKALVLTIDILVQMDMGSGPVGLCSSAPMPKAKLAAQGRCVSGGKTLA